MRIFDVFFFMPLSVHFFIHLFIYFIFFVSYLSFYQTLHNIPFYFYIFPLYLFLPAHDHSILSFCLCFLSYLYSLVLCLSYLFLVRVCLFHFIFTCIYLFCLTYIFTCFMTYFYLFIVCLFHFIFICIYFFYVYFSRPPTIDLFLPSRLIYFLFPSVPSIILFLFAYTFIPP